MTHDPKVRFLDRTTPPHIGTLIAITGTAAMAMNMFLPSLPSMTAYFETEYRVMQLSVALFLAINGALQLFVGPLSDRYGRRPVLLWGFTLFLLATVGCIAATSVEVFLFFRMCQASSVVAMVLSRAVIRDMHDEASAATTLSYVTMGMAVVPMVSPMIGGALDEWLGWKSVFWVYLLIGAATLWLIWADLGETNTAKSASFREQIRNYPELLTSPRFWGYAAAAAFASGAFFSYLGGAPFIGSEVFGLNPTTLGFSFGAPAMGYIAGNYVTARNSGRLGINVMITAGSAIIAGGVALSLTIFYLGYGNAATFFAFMVFMGFGNGMVMPSAISGSLSVRPRLAGTASGLGGALMIGGGAAMSALTGSLLGPGSGPYPLLWIQLILGTLALVAIRLVVARERRLSLA